MNGKFLMFWGEYLHKTIILCSQYIQANESGLLAHSNQRGGKKRCLKNFS
jgi:hypothetical protein